MSDAELESCIDNTEDLFEDEEEKEKFIQDFNTNDATKVPAQKYILTKEGLADLARASIKRDNEEKNAITSKKVHSESFKRRIHALSEHVIEWCNYKASIGEWRHEYDFSKIDEDLFGPTVTAIRTKMVDVVIVMHKTRTVRKIVVEWGSSGM